MRENAAEGASSGGRAGREDDFRFEYVQLNVCVCYPNGHLSNRDLNKRVKYRREIRVGGTDLGIISCRC